MTVCLFTWTQIFAIHDTSEYSSNINFVKYFIFNVFHKFVFAILWQIIHILHRDGFTLVTG